jgi:hypothetical protein
MQSKFHQGKKYSYREKLSENLSGEEKNIIIFACRYGVGP